MHDVDRAIRAADVDWLACWLVNVFPGIPEAAVLEMLTQWVQRAATMGFGWQDDDWRMWFENRLREVGWTPPCGGRSEPGRLVVPLHVFFIHIEENPTHLENLCRWHAETLEEAFRGPSTPGIERATQILTPIDRTARRVVSSQDAAG